MSAVFKVILCPSCGHVSDQKMWKKGVTGSELLHICPNCKGQHSVTRLDRDGYTEQVEFF